VIITDTASQASAALGHGQTTRRADSTHSLAQIRMLVPVCLPPPPPSYSNSGGGDRDASSLLLLMRECVPHQQQA